MIAAGGATDRCDFDVVAIRNVSRHYGRRRALAGVTLECRASSIVGLFGPNGAGKSTLLGILSTLQTPSSGDVRYGAHSARVWGDALRGRVGVLGHDLFLYPDLSARENLRFFGQLYGLSAAALESRIERALLLRQLRIRRLVHDARLALNAVGGASALNLANALADRGTHVTYGAMGRQPLKIPNGLLIFREITFRGFWLRNWRYDATLAQKGETLGVLATMIAGGKLTREEADGCKYELNYKLSVERK